MERLLISACLIGANCKYSGGNNGLAEETMLTLKSRYRLLPACPEVAGGLSVPRNPSERRETQVVNCCGEAVTEAFARGADCALTLCRRFRCEKALLKANSPSCGSGQIYDGSFRGILTCGDGVTTEKLKNEGILVVTEKELDTLF